ncbi:hypothetical protein N0V83_003279 [Neocucurbitaria cava]|uniref:Uncharacterized protein n=1 Tax=Neocucurbitaria cava TaxID=798079 RepID=A0A9W9CNI3_9PLEO|nr:hypothetical protein N0V83_003279 [Neocucurbitaria cava]
MAYALLEYSTGCYAPDRRQGMTRDLYSLIDEHLAWQLDRTEHQRPTSSGTMFLDWDGSEAPKVTYRNSSSSISPSLTPSPPSPNPLKPLRSNSPEHIASRRGRQKPLPPLPPQMVCDDGLEVTYQPHHFSPTTQRVRSPCVAGYDPRTAFSYKYNGRVMHVHRDTPAVRNPRFSDSSAYSEYYAVDADKYVSGVPLKVVDDDDDDDGKVEGGKAKKRERVVGFVQKVLGKLDGLGVMKKLGEERRGVKMAKEKQAWVREGYVT